MFLLRNQKEDARRSDELIAKTRQALEDNRAAVEAIKARLRR